MPRYLPKVPLTRHYIHQPRTPSRYLGNSGNADTALRDELATYLTGRRVIVTALSFQGKSLPPINNASHQ